MRVYSFGRGGCVSISEKTERETDDRRGVTYSWKSVASHAVTLIDLLPSRHSFDGSFSLQLKCR